MSNFSEFSETWKTQTTRTNGSFLFLFITMFHDKSPLAQMFISNTKYLAASVSTKRLCMNYTYKLKHSNSFSRGSVNLLFNLNYSINVKTLASQILVQFKYYDFNVFLVFKITDRAELYLRNNL